jgi:hypothetical protein
MKAFTFCIISTFLLPAVAEKVRRNSRIQSLNQPNPLHGINSPQAIEGRLLKLIDEVVDPKMDPKSGDPKLDQKKDPKKGAEGLPPKGGENAAPGGLFGAGGDKTDGLLSTNALQASSGSMGGPGSVAKAAAVVGGLVGLAAYNF